MTRKFLALLLGLLVVLTALPSLAEDSTTLDVMIQYNSTESYLDFNNGMAEYFGPIEEATGVHAVFTQVLNTNWTTQLNLVLASQEYPDVIIRGSVDVEQYGVDQKVLLPLDDYIDQMPNYKALLDYEPGMREMLTATDGKMYAFGYLIPQNISVFGHYFINRSWLEKLNLKEPTTVDELEQVLIAFRDNDPNGNGLKDEIPYTGRLLDGNYGLNNLLSAWGIPMNTDLIMLDDDGKVTAPMLQPGFREGLETLSRWYNDGLLDRECISQDTNNIDAKLQGDTIGSFVGWRLINMGYAEHIPQDFECILPVTAEGYQAKLPRLLEIPTYSAYITTANKNIEATLRWLDAQFDFDTMMKFYNGVDYVGMGENGKYDILGVDSLDKQIPGQSCIFFAPGSYYFEHVNMPVHRVEKSNYCKWYEDNGVVEKNSFQQLTSLCKLNVTDSEEITKLKSEIVKFVEENMTRFITQGVDDASWTEFMSNLDKLKLGRYIELYQNAYDAMLAAK